jgi:hypothetical protein
VTSELSTRSARSFERYRRLRCAISRVAHHLRPTDPPRLTSWKSLESPTNPLLTSRVALQAPPSDSKSDGSSSRFLFQDRAPFLPATPGMPLQDSVRSLKSKPRDAFRRALPNTKTLSSARISPVACFSGRIACHECAPFRLGQSHMSRQRGM